MMRQTKFRGKRKDTGEWVYGDLLHIDGGCLIYFGSQTETETPYIENSSPVAVELFKTEIAVVDPESVGQFTGLLDAKQKEIYEGDILSANGRVVGWVKGGVRGYCYDVVYVNHPAGEKRWTLYATVMNDYKGKIEITGNIHDTPELLNDK